MSAEIYMTILQGDNRLVISGDMKLFQDLVTTIQGAAQIPSAMIYNPAPDQPQEIKSQGGKHA